MIVGSKDIFAGNSKMQILKIKRGHEARWASHFVTRVVFGISATSRGIQECQSLRSLFLQSQPFNGWPGAIQSLDMSARVKSRALSCGEFLLRLSRISLHVLWLLSIYFVEINRIPLVRGSWKNFSKSLLHVRLQERFVRYRSDFGLSAAG